MEIQEGYAEIEVIIKCPSESEEVRKIAALLQGCDQRLSGVRDGVTALVDRQDALYFESVDKRCYLYTADAVYETALKLYELEDRLADAGFIRGSKSQILNISKISSLCPDFGGRLEARLCNGETLIVSRQYAKQLKERLGLK